MIGATLFVFNVQVELLQICRPLMMAMIPQIPLCLYKLKRSVIVVDECLLTQNVMLPLSESLHDGMNLFIIGGVLMNCVRKFSL